MPVDFRMPSLGPDMESGTLVEWRVKPGDAVKRGDVIALVETDKGVIDVEVFSDGVVQQLLVDTGATVPVGSALARLSGESGETGLLETAPAAAAEKKAEAPRREEVPPQVAPAVSERVRISPAARVKARELGIDPDTIAGSGPGGVITLEDVERHRPRAAAAAASGEGMREVIARAMSRSKREIPHYYLGTTCNFVAARTWLEQYNARVSVEMRLLPAALFLKAVAVAAKAMPEFNGSYGEQGFKPAADVNVGMAIAMRGGRLVAPAILGTDTKSVAELMSELRDLTNRVRSGHMRATELALPTITVTSLGEDGVETIVPVIYPPQVAMVGFGSVIERPWVIDGAVHPAPLIEITVAADHRVTDGRSGARFLARIRDALQAPEQL